MPPPLQNADYAPPPQYTIAPLPCVGMHSINFPSFMVFLLPMSHTLVLEDEYIFINQK